MNLFCFGRTQRFFLVFFIFSSMLLANVSEHSTKISNLPAGYAREIINKTLKFILNSDLEKKNHQSFKP